MTRVNLVDPGCLTDQHLLAEYREIPRVITCSENHYAKHGTYIPDGMPDRYVLGAGHVKFFYDKQWFIWGRHQALIAEMKKRLMKPTIELPQPTQPNTHWEPEDIDMLTNARRLVDRILNSKSRPMYYRKEITREEAKAHILMEFSFSVDTDKY